MAPQFALSSSNRKGVGAVGAMRVDRDDMPGHFVDAGLQWLIEPHMESGRVGWIGCRLCGGNRGAARRCDLHAGECGNEPLSESKPQFAWRARNSAAHGRNSVIQKGVGESRARGEAAGEGGAKNNSQETAHDVLCFVSTREICNLETQRRARPRG